MAQEILAGAASEGDYSAYLEDWVEPFEKLGRVITPGHSAWMRAALMMRLVQRRKMSAGGFARGFLNDCLVAASAHEHGFVLMTRNTSDFDRIREVAPGFEYTAPWPGRVGGG